MKKLVFALAVMLFSYSAFAQNTKKHLSSYLAVKNALVSGDSKAASQAVITLQQSIKEDASFAEKETLLKSLSEMAKAGNIAGQRAVFNDVSTNIWKVIKSSDAVVEPIYYQYCPMKKAYWLSSEKQIKNPYYGSAMLACGSVVETK
ncbi:MAG: Protein of uncharacterized function [Sphingobacteriaceae bacterium]|jgi:hypothetical protein|nr:Protein of uncharacterized function [Sphingobacteriaceae bacterium]